MPRDPGPAAEWLRHAQSKLDLARQPKPTRVLWDHLCFEAQQAAEKAVKAVYREIEFPPTHDIRQLLTLLGSTLPEWLWEAAAALTPYAVLSRYPGVAPPASEETYRRLVGLAEQVVLWAEEVGGSSGAEEG